MTYSELWSWLINDQPTLTIILVGIAVYAVGSFALAVWHESSRRHH